MATVRIDTKPAQASVKGLDDTLSKAETTMKSVDRSLDTLERSINKSLDTRETKRSFDALDRSVRRTAKNLNEFSASSSKANATTKSETVSVNKLAAAYGRLKVSIASAYAASKASLTGTAGQGMLRGAIGASGSLWMSYGPMAAMAGGLAAASTVMKVQEYGADFEYLTQKAHALEVSSDGVTISLGKLREGLLGLQDLTHTPEELAAGFVEAAQASVNLESLLNDSAIMSHIAEITEADFSDVIKSVIGMNRAFDTSFAESSNIIFAAANKSRASFDELIAGMEHTTEMGTLAGASLQEVSSAMATVIAGGISASKAGTSLRTSYFRLISPSKQAAKVLDDIGFSAFDSQGHIKSLGVLYSDLSDALKEAGTEQERLNVLATVFDRRSMKAPGLLLSSLENYKEVYEATMRANEGVGAVDKAWEDLADTVHISAEQLKADFHTALIEAFDSDKAQKILKDLRELVTDESFKLAVVGLAQAFYYLATALTTIANLPGRMWDLLNNLAEERAAAADFNQKIAEFANTPMDPGLKRPENSEIQFESTSLSFDEVLAQEGGAGLPKTLESLEKTAAKGKEVVDDFVTHSKEQFANARDEYDRHLNAINILNADASTNNVQEVEDTLAKMEQVGLSKLRAYMEEGSEQYKKEAAALHKTIYEGAYALDALAKAREKDARAIEKQNKALGLPTLKPQGTKMIGIAPGAAETCAFNQIVLDCTEQAYNKLGLMSDSEKKKRIDNFEEAAKTAIAVSDGSAEARLKIEKALQKQIKKLDKDANENAVKLQKELVNDLGRVIEGSLSGIFKGEVDSISDMFEELFNGVMDMYVRMLSQFAANSLIDAMFGPDASGGMTLTDAFDGMVSMASSGSSESIFGSIAALGTSAYDSVAGLFGATEIAAAPTATAAGAELAFGTAAEQTALTAASTTSMASMAATVVPYVGAAMAAYMVGDMMYSMFHEPNPLVYRDFETSSGSTWTVVDHEQNDPYLDAAIGLSQQAHDTVNDLSSMSDELERFRDGLDVLAFQFQDDMAIFYDSLNQGSWSVEEFAQYMVDNFGNAMQLSVEQTAYMEQLASEAFLGSTESLGLLIEQFELFGLTSQNAAESAMAMTSAIEGMLGTDINGDDIIYEGLYPSEDDAPEELATDYTDQLASLMDQIDKVIHDAGSTNIEQEYYDISKKYEKIFEDLNEYGATSEEIAEAQKAMNIEMRQAILDNNKAVNDMMDDFQHTIDSQDFTTLEEDLYNINQRYEDIFDTLDEYGANAVQVDTARAAQEAEINAAIEANDMAIDSLLNNYVALNEGMTDTETWLFDLGLAYEDAIRQAEELGMSESQLSEIRAAQAVEIQNQIDSIMGSVEDVINKNTMSDLEYQTWKINEQFDEMKASLIALGATTSDLTDLEEARRLELENLQGIDPVDYYEDLINMGAVVSTFGSNQIFAPVQNDVAVTV